MTKQKPSGKKMPADLVEAIEKANASIAEGWPNWDPTHRIMYATSIAHRKIPARYEWDLVEHAKGRPPTVKVQF